MHIDVVPNRGSPPTYPAARVLSRRREGAQAHAGQSVRLSPAQIDAIRAVLRGEPLRPVAQRFEITASRAHGHVQAVAVAMQRLGFASLLASKPCRERDLVLAMVAARIIAPHTKLATTRWWHTTTLAEDFGVADADEDDLYAAMDWLLARQDAIEKKLAARHLRAGSLVLYDLSSSYFEGSTCPLAKLGYNRDGKKRHAAGQLRPAHRSRAAARWRCRCTRAISPTATTLHARGASGCARTSASSSW